MEKNEIISLWKQKVKEKYLKKELDNLNETQISERFVSNLEFGTAGLRGKIGVGSNFMNIYTVSLSTNAICEYILQQKIKNPLVVIGYDTRRYSKLFAKTTSEIFIKKGINVYLSKEVIPSPFVSYLVRKLSANMGIMITASHNPKEYNGYKVFDNRGCQISTETANEIAKIMSKLDVFDNAITEEKKGALRYIGNDLKEEFLKDLSKVQIHPKLSDIKIIYSPLNGTGIKFVPQILKKNNYQNIKMPLLQSFASSKFKTCPYPNPEEIDTYKESLKLAQKFNADIIILTDPDADRIGCMVLSNGKYEFINGNEIGLLMMQYVLVNKKFKNGFVVSTIVTSPMVEKLTKKHSVECYLTLTGFKNIANKVDEVLKTNKQFVFAFEESNGYMPTTFTRDKDGISASLLLAEMTSFYKSKNLTLFDVLQDLKSQPDYEFEERKYIVLDGTEGKNKINKAMEQLRKVQPKVLIGQNITAFVDFNLNQNPEEKSNIISLQIAQNSKIIVRPSGTEPKLKFYSFANSKDKAQKQIEELISYMKLS